MQYNSMFCSSRRRPAGGCAEIRAASMVRPNNRPFRSGELRAPGATDGRPLPRRRCGSCTCCSSTRSTPGRPTWRPWPRRLQRQRQQVQQQQQQAGRRRWRQRPARRTCAAWCSGAARRPRAHGAATSTASRPRCTCRRCRATSPAWMTAWAAAPATGAPSGGSAPSGRRRPAQAGCCCRPRRLPPTWRQERRLPPTAPAARPPAPQAPGRLRLHSGLHGAQLPRAGAARVHAHEARQARQGLEPAHLDVDALRRWAWRWAWPHRGQAAPGWRRRRRGLPGGCQGAVP
jgi:hypothetical protein